LGVSRKQKLTKRLKVDIAQLAKSKTSGQSKPRTASAIQ